MVRTSLKGMGVLTQAFELPFGAGVSCRGAWFWFSILLICPGGSRGWPKLLGPCHSHESPRWGSWLLPGPALSLLTAEEWTGRWKSSLSLPLHSAFHIIVNIYLNQSAWVQSQPPVSSSDVMNTLVGELGWFLLLVQVVVDTKEWPAERFLCLSVSLPLK